jgi:hypothetical protein
VQRGGGPAAAAEYARLVAGIRKAQPDNLAALVEAARAAAASGDAAGARQALAGLETRSAAWPPAAKAQLALFRAAVGGPNVRAAAVRVAFLRNVLQRVPEYRQGIERLEGDREQAGQPLEAF